MTLDLTVAFKVGLERSIAQVENWDKTKQDKRIASLRDICFGPLDEFLKRLNSLSGSQLKIEENDNTGDDEPAYSVSICDSARDIGVISFGKDICVISFGVRSLASNENHADGSRDLFFEYTDGSWIEDNIDNQKLPDDFLRQEDLASEYFSTADDLVSHAVDYVLAPYIQTHYDARAVLLALNAVTDEAPTPARCDAPVPTQG